MMEASKSKRKRLSVSSGRKNSMKINDDNESNSNLVVSLPNDMIHNIFTFLPIKHAISSSLVAKQFLNSWLYARNLCFDVNFEMNLSLNGREDRISIIENIISNYLGKKIHSFHLYVPEPMKYSPFFSKWIQLVASKGLEELELHLAIPTNGYTYFLHSDYIDVETLRSLKLICCNLLISPQSKGFPFLKSLSLIKVQIVPALIKWLFISCMVLESLALEGCSSFGEYTIKGSDKFRTLLIRDCEGIILVTIDNSSITTFHYDGEINKIKFVNPIKLKDVILDFGATKGLQHINGRDELMRAFRNVETLSINNVLLEGLSSRFINFEYKDMEYYLPNLKELQLVRRGPSFINPWDIVFFIKNCSQIERLFIDLGDYAMEAGSYWNSIAKEKFENCETEFPELKVLKVKGFKALDLEKKLINFLSLRAKSLESLILVKSKNNRLQIKKSDITAISKVANIFIYAHRRDESFVFPKHRVL